MAAVIFVGLSNFLDFVIAGLVVVALVVQGRRISSHERELKELRALIARDGTSPFGVPPASGAGARSTSSPSAPPAAYPVQPPVYEMPAAYAMPPAYEMPPAYAMPAAYVVPPAYEMPPSSPAFPPHEQTASQSSLERVVGRGVLGIVASVLVFLGLVFLGLLALPLLPDSAKIALMYAVSFALAGGGVLLSRRRPNAFTLALAGCGFGSLFLSIVLTHFTFHAINDIVALCLLLVWLLGCLALAKRTGAPLYFVIAQIGMAISLCIAYAGGVDEGRTVVVLAYQAVATALIVAGGRLCFTGAYRASLVVSLSLAFMTTLAVWGSFAPTLGEFSGALAIVPAVAMAFQCLGAIALSYLLYEAVRPMPCEGGARFALHLANKALLLAVLFVASVLYTELFVHARFGVGAGLGAVDALYATLLVSMGLAFATAALHMAASVVAGRVHPRDGDLERISVLCAAVYAGVVFVAVYAEGAFVLAPGYLLVPGLLGVAALLCVVGRMTGQSIYELAALVALGVDALLMCGSGYARLADSVDVIAPFFYLAVILLGVAYCWSRRVGEARRRVSRNDLLMTLLLAFEVSMASITVAARFEWRIVLAIFILVALGWAAADYARTRGAARSSAFAPADHAPGTSPLFVVKRLHEVLLVLFCCPFIASTVFDPSLAAGSWMLALLCLAALTLGVLSVERSPGVAWLATVQGIMFTLVVLAFIRGTTRWFHEAYVLSLVCMFVALACVGIGFALRLKPLRLYGLVLIIMSVLKLVSLDLGEVSSIMRVVAFIMGGLICFGISALYSYAVKRFDEEQLRPVREASDQEHEWNDYRG